MTPPTVTQEPRKRPGPACQPRPFPIESLERLMPGRCSAARAETLGVQYRQLLRLRRSGLTTDQADRLAVAAGFHPSEVWQDWWKAGHDG